MKRIEDTSAQVYLVNTGWTGGAYGQGGERFSIPTTRAIVRAILEGDLENVDYQTMPGFNLQIPKTVAGVDDNLLNPENVWPLKRLRLNKREQQAQQGKDAFHGDGRCHGPTGRTSNRA